MEPMSLVLGLLTGLVAGAAGALWWARGRGNTALTLLQGERAAKDLEIHARQQEIVRLSVELAGERERNSGLNEKLAQQRAELEQVNARMTDQFKLIANELLETKGRQLGQEQHDKLDLLLKPLKERIKEFEEQVKKTYQEEERERFSLKKEIMRLVEQNQKLSQDADNLTRALKGDSKTQGDWGEMVLERLLESSGLVNGEEYVLQASTTQADGTRLRPDAVIHLPGDKHIVIDAKVSLTHYERFVSATDEVERERLARAHTDSVRAHVKGLSLKDYPSIYGFASLDFVFMFVPIEAAFNLAQVTRREIVREAIDQGVFIVTHGNLLSSLKLFHGMWKNERITRNHLEIAERAGALYDKFDGFTQDLGKIGKQIQGAQDSYEDALKKLRTGPGNLVRQVEMLKELGAKTAKSLHPKLLEPSLEEQNTSME